MALRLMSFNIRYGTADDGAHSWPLRSTSAIEAIRSQKVDIVCLQEALRFQLDEVLGALGSYECVGVGRDDGISEGEHSAILYDPARLKLRRSGTYWFSATPEVPGSRHPGCFHPRICTWGDFEGGDGPISVSNLHLDNESAAARALSTELLVSRLSSLPTVVAGDFNVGESDPCLDVLREAGLEDSFRKIHPDDPGGTYHGFSGEPTSEKIDTIWIDSSWEVMDATIVRAKFAGAWPSDHYPVTATIRGVR